jgi:hypothetical protein
MFCVSFHAKELDHIEKFQSNNVKRIFRLLIKRSHHSRLLKALGIKNFTESIMRARNYLFNRIFRRQSPHVF